MELKGKISISAPEIVGNSGTKTYVSNLFSGLDSAGVKYNKIMVKKREISILGKPFFGFLSQYANAVLKSASTPIVHSLSPDSIIKGTNLVTIHDIIPLMRRDIYFKSLYDKMAFNNSLGRLLKIDNLLLSTELGKAELIKNLNVDESRLKVLHLSIDHNNFYPSNKNPYLENGKLKVLMISDFNPRKRIDIAIESLIGNDEVDFYHIGPANSWEGKLSEARRLAGTAKNIHLLGEVSPDKLRDYLTFADLFLYLSEAEGFGYPPIEAMACGTNVLVSDIGIFHETLEDKANFVKISEFSVDQIKKALGRRHASNDLIQYSENYSINKYVTGLLRIYDSIIE